MEVKQKGRGISQKRRDKIHNAYDRYSRPVEKQFENLLIGMFNDQAKRLRIAYNKVIKESKNENGMSEKDAEKLAKDIVVSIAIWDIIENETLMGLFSAYLNAGEQGNTLSILLSGEDVLFNVIRKEYVIWVNTQGAKQIKRVTETTKDIVRRVVKNGLIDGVSTSNIAKEIESKVKELGKKRAITIARTEVHNSMMFAREVNFKRAGFQYWRWISSKDERVRGNKPTDRFNHIQNDNVIRKIGDKFPSGITRPGDPLGEPGNIINCRCDVIPATKEEYEKQRGAA